MTITIFKDDNYVIYKNEITDKLIIEKIITDGRGTLLKPNSILDIDFYSEISELIFYLLFQIESNEKIINNMSESLSCLCFKAGSCDSNCKKCHIGNING